MASLVEELASVLGGQIEASKELYKLSMDKTPILVQGDLDALQKLTEAEQLVVDRLAGFDRKRERLMSDIADVTNRKSTGLTLSELIDSLASGSVEAARKQAVVLSGLRDDLADICRKLARVNAQNEELVKSSLEIIDYDLNLVQSMRAAPETANYGRRATGTDSVLGRPTGGFDAKS